MNLLIFGYGYTSAHLVGAMPSGAAESVRVTTRSPEKAALLRATGMRARVFPGTDMAEDLAWATHVLVTAGPQGDQDPVLADPGTCTALTEQAGHLDWIGYLSTTGVYGNQNGGWVDESTPALPGTVRGRARLTVESDWTRLYTQHDLPVHLFRLAGIYGPGRSPLDRVRQGTARRIIKPGQFFSRCHVADIAQVLRASMAAPNPGAIYNVCDDLPAPPEDVIAHAAELLGVAPPPEVPFDEADLSPMGRSFYAESKRVRNDRIKTELQVRLMFPDYRSGLKALLSDASRPAP